MAQTYRESRCEGSVHGRPNSAPRSSAFRPAIDTSSVTFTVPDGYIDVDFSAGLKRTTEKPVDKLLTNTLLSVHAGLEGPITM
jgi:hypothetical protein